MKLIRDIKAKSLTYYVSDSIPFLDYGLISEIKKIAFDTKENVRLCLHKSRNDVIHNMVIFQWKEQFFKIHKHYKNIEVCHIIEGEHNFYIYDENGKVENIFHMDIKNPLLRIPENTYHLSIPITEYVIFHEVKIGPFDPLDNIFLGNQ